MELSKEVIKIIENTNYSISTWLNIYSLYENIDDFYIDHGLSFDENVLKKHWYLFWRCGSAEVGVAVYTLHDKVVAISFQTCRKCNEDFFWVNSYAKLNVKMHIMEHSIKKQELNIDKQLIGLDHINRISDEMFHKVKSEGVLSEFGYKYSNTISKDHDYKKLILNSTQKEKTYTQKELDSYLNDVMNLGMETRQNQLNHYESRSGNQILDEWKAKNL